MELIGIIIIIGIIIYVKGIDKNKIKEYYDLGYMELEEYGQNDEEYMESEEWNIKRCEILRRAGYRCRDCGITGVPLDVHHETYARFGNEKLSDLTALCRDCHDEVHRS